MKKLLILLVLLGFCGAVSAPEYKSVPVPNADLYCMKCGRVIYRCLNNICQKQVSAAEDIEWDKLLSCPFDDSGLKMREL